LTYLHLLCAPLEQAKTESWQVFERGLIVAAAAVQALALRVMADRLEHGEVLPDELLSVSFIAA
jgi:hypothetical protein